MLTKRRRWLPVGVGLFLGLVVWPSLVQAQYFAKINNIRIEEDGQPIVYATVLDRFGEPPELSDYDNIQVFFGQANQFDLDDNLELQLFKDTEEATDYVIILPAYEGFGINNAVAAAEGAGAFQLAHVGENDTCVIIKYGDGVELLEVNAAELAPTYREEEGVARVARPYMLSAFDEAVRWFHEAAPGRRRIIIVVGTGLDVRLSDAANVELPENAYEGDYERAFRNVLEDHTLTLRRYIEALEEVDARVYAIGYNEGRDDYLEVLRVLSRKTGGTFRRVSNIGQLATTGGTSGVFDWVGEELASELVLKPDFTVEGEREYEVWAKFRFPDPVTQQVLEDITTRTYYLTTPPAQAGRNIIWYLVVIGAILIVVFLLLVVLYFLLKRLRGQRSAIAERKALEDRVAAANLHCKTCYRVMMAEWDSCMFCAGGMETLGEKPQVMLDAEEAQQKLDELDGIGVDQRAAEVAGSAAAVAAYAAATKQNQCPTCFRIMDPSWTTCLFCDAGMAPLAEAPQVQQPVGDLAVPVAGRGMAPVAPQQQAAPAAGAAAAGAAAAGGGVATISIKPGDQACPQCGRPVPPDWEECLYCKAGI